MKGKAQISLFIIVGIILIIISIFFISLTSKNKEDNLIVDDSINFDIEKKQVNEFIDSCLEKSSTNAIYSLGNTGMVLKDENSLEFNEVDYLTFYFYEKDLIPEILQIENSLNVKTKENFISCFDDIKISYDYNFSYDVNDLKITSKVKNDFIQFDLSFPLLVSNVEVGDFYLEDFNYKLNYNIIEKISLISNFIEFESKDLTSFDISNLIKFAKSNDFKYEFKYVDNEVILFTFIFDDFVKDKLFKYSFLFKYNWEVKEYE